MGDAGVSIHTSKRRQEQQKITLSNCFHKRVSGSTQTVQQVGVPDSSQAILDLRCVDPGVRLEGVSRPKIKTETDKLSNYGTANRTWDDILECCFKSEISKLESLFSLKRGKRDL
jgi:hypothetical protein